MSVKQKNPHPLFLTNNIKTQRIQTKTFYTVFQVLNVVLIKVCKIQSLDLLLLVVFLSFYISRYHFPQVFRTSFNIIWENVLAQIFLFYQIHSSSHHHHPLNSQNPLSVTNLSQFFIFMMLWWRLEELEQQSRNNISMQLQSQVRCLHINAWSEVS